MWDVGHSDSINPYVNAIHKMSNKTAAYRVCSVYSYINKVGHFGTGRSACLPLVHWPKLGLKKTFPRLAMNPTFTCDIPSK